MMMLVRTEWRIHEGLDYVVRRKRHSMKLRSSSKFCNVRFDGD